MASHDSPDLTSGRVTFRAAAFSGYHTGALDIVLQARRIISIPTQLGCRVGCTFCVSQDTPVIRNLSAAEMLEMVRLCLTEEPADGRPLELSFTGEGEAVLNWREASAVCRALPTLCADFAAVRYCFSGIGADLLLEKLDGAGYPVRLQFSLHAARQAVRDQLVPRSLPLVTLLAALRAQAHRFSAIELNVVLQEGVNDSDEDLRALVAWGDPAWRILLNPHLRDGQEHEAPRTTLFRETLRAAGRPVAQYTKIAARVSRNRIYPLMSARRAAGPAQ
jgi:adenine C2-methylase RlmN of 23S rRNA A2503 and tRNA A37